MENKEYIDRLAVIKLRKKKAIEKMNQLKDMTWIQIIQLPENKDRLKRMEAMQRETFEQVCRKKHKHLLPEWKDLFAEFFIDFLKGKVDSIASFLYEDKYDSKHIYKKRFLPIKE